MYILTLLCLNSTGMKASSRSESESMNAYFDGYVNSMTSLSEFIEQYDKAVLDRRDKEKKEDLSQ